MKFVFAERVEDVLRAAVPHLGERWSWRRCKESITPPNGVRKTATDSLLRSRFGMRHSLTEPRP